MFDRIIDTLIQWAVFFIPFVVLDPFEQGVVIRFGKPIKDLEPGFHWIIPFQVDRVLADNVVPRTTDLPAQSLTTKDGVSIVTSAIVTSSISNIRKATLGVEGVDDALRDSCCGAIGTLVASYTWDEIRGEPFIEIMTRACRKNGWRFGIEIERVQLSDLVTARTYRLLN